jgi:hypothetical protein
MIRENVVELLARIHFADTDCPASWLVDGRELDTVEMAAVHRATVQEWAAAGQKVRSWLAAEDDRIEADRRALAARLAVAV